MHKIYVYIFKTYPIIYIESLYAPPQATKPKPHLHWPLTLPLLALLASLPLTTPYNQTNPPVAPAINPALAANNPTLPPVLSTSKIGYG
jgi:hypothetical protein